MSFEMLKLDELGNASFGMLKLDELGAVRFGILKLGEFRKVNSGLLKLGEFRKVILAWKIQKMPINSNLLLSYSIVDSHLLCFLMVKI